MDTLREANTRDRELDLAAAAGVQLSLGGVTPGDLDSHPEMDAIVELAKQHTSRQLRHESASPQPEPSLHYESASEDYVDYAGRDFATYHSRQQQYRQAFEKALDDYVSSCLNIPVCGENSDDDDMPGDRDEDPIPHNNISSKPRLYLFYNWLMYLHRLYWNPTGPPASTSLQRGLESLA